MYDILIGIIEYLLYMKLVDLVEGYHQIKKQVYDIGLFVQDEFAEYVGINLDIDVTDYGAFISNPAGVITNILQDVTSTIITKYPNKNITIYEMKVIGRFKDLHGTILIGNLKSLFDTGGRRIPIIVDNNQSFNENRSIEVRVAEAKALAKAGSVSGHGGARLSRPVSGTLRPPQKAGLVVMGQRGAV
jgi:hypothetical protein